MNPTDFFDRLAYINIIRKRVGAFTNGYRQNLALIGNESVGKTAIVCKFLEQFQDNRIVPLYVEVEPETFKSFARRFIGSMLYNFLINSGQELKEDLDFLLRKASSFAPQTVSRINLFLKVSGKKAKPHLFLELLSLCEALYQETSKSCVVIFDEFQNLEYTGVKNLYQEWSKVLISQKHTMYIITSSRKFKASVILSKHLSLLFGNFEVVTIEPFDSKTSLRFLDQAFAPLSIEPAVKNFIVHFTGGHPFYLDLIARAYAQSQGRDLAAVIQELIFDDSGILHQRFINFLKRILEGKSQSHDYVDILFALSEGYTKIRDIAHILRKSHKELLLRVGYLLESDALSRSGDFLKMNDRVFGFWVRFVHQGKIQAMTFDAKNQKAVFKEKIEKMIGEFILQAQRPVVERVADLLGLFQDETVQIEKKNIRLYPCREIKPLEFNYKAFREGLLGRSNDCLWIIAMKYDLLTEEDISEFVRECKKYRHKLQRRVIIAFQGVEVNANLRAMEEKILTWDVNYLNQFLDMYSKPRVIV